MNWAGFPLACPVSIRMRDPLFSQAQGIFRCIRTVGGISRRRSDSPLPSAARSSMIFTMANMPSKAGWKRGTPLRIAAACGHLDLVRTLQEQGVDIRTHEDDALRSAAD